MALPRALPPAAALPTSAPVGPAHSGAGASRTPSPAPPAPRARPPPSSTSSPRPPARPGLATSGAGYLATAGGGGATRRPPPRGWVELSCVRLVLAPFPHRSSRPSSLLPSAPLCAVSRPLPGRYCRSSQSAALTCRSTQLNR